MTTQVSLALTALLITQTSHAASPLAAKLRESVGIDKHVVHRSYGPDPEEKVDIIYGDRSKPSPTVILIHGGAWAGGDKADFAREAQELAKRGFTVLNINYRLAKPGDTHTQWPAQREDIRLAVRWARANAAAYGIDPKNICAMGDSAGGNLAMVLGYDQRNLQGDRSDNLKDYSSRVKCVISRFGPADLSHPEFVKTLPNPTHLNGKTAAEAPALFRDASPASHINSEAAPTLLISARNDRIVPHKVNVDFADELKKKGGDVKLVSVSGDHMFTGANAAEQKMAFSEVLLFLNKHLLAAEANEQRGTGQPEPRKPPQAPR